MKEIRFSFFNGDYRNEFFKGTICSSVLELNLPGCMLP